MTRLRVIDLETTGMEPPAEIIEIGCVDLVNAGSSWVIEPTISQLFRPLRGIPPETMAVHHLIPADFEETTPVCGPQQLQEVVLRAPSPDILVAHNCAFERAFLTDATRDLPWICTQKAALPRPCRCTALVPTHG